MPTFHVHDSALYARPLPKEMINYNRGEVLIITIPYVAGYRWRNIIIDD